jgi:hypothetical protein
MVNFPGFAQLFAQSNPAMLPVSTPVLAPTAAPRHQTLPPPMILATFCTLYGLSDDITKKLEAIHIAGPHVLSLISDTDLQGEGTLSVGELASV